MLDTVILQIPINYSDIIDHNQFSPSAKIFEYIWGYFRCVNNPTAIDEEMGVYKPKLTITRRGREIYLKTEFSAPKLIFGNNLDEIEKSHFDEIVFKLRKLIEEMGVRLWSWQIEKAEVLSFHPSKNILLSKGYNSLFAIRELFKIDVSKKFDITKVKYSNGGEELQIYSNSNSLVFYDKIKDLNKPAKRAIDKDQTLQQFSLFDCIKNQEKRIEILRMEARLSKKRKMNEVLTQLGYSKNPTFKDIFKKELCQRILKHYWDYFFSDNLFLFSVQNEPQKILNEILKQNPRIGIKKAIYQMGFLILCKDDEGMKGFRNIAELYKPKTNWTNLKKWLANYQDKINAIPMHGFIEDIERAITEFKAFRLSKKDNNYLVDL